MDRWGRVSAILFFIIVKPATLLYCWFMKSQTTKLFTISGRGSVQTIQWWSESQLKPMRASSWAHILQEREAKEISTLTNSSLINSGSSKIWHHRELCRRLSRAITSIDESVSSWTCEMPWSKAACNAMRQDSASAQVASCTTYSLPAPANRPLPHDHELYIKPHPSVLLLSRNAPSIFSFSISLGGGRQLFSDLHGKYKRHV